ncbi:MAG: hypothetical protein ACHQ03_07780 [Candidatus Bathyarchaeia archaeon]
MTPKAYVLILFSVVLLSGLAHANAQDPRTVATGDLYQARYQIGSAFGDLQKFWTNVTESTRANATLDLSAAYSDLMQGFDMLNGGFYNDSMRDSITAQFLADRAAYRISLDLAWQAIESANNTLNGIPTNIPQPTEAHELLDNATTIYNQYLYEYYLEIPRLTTLQITDKSNANFLEEAKPKLYSDPNSAYNYARKALVFSEKYREDQENALSVRMSLVNAYMFAAIPTILVLVAIATVYTVRDPILFVSRRAKRRFRPILASATTVEDTFGRRENIDILMRTTGTLLTGVVAIIGILSILNSIYVSIGARLNVGFATSTIIDFLWPIISFAVSLLSGGFALVSGSSRKRKWFGWFAFLLFAVGTVAFAFFAWLLLTSLSL